MRSPTSAMPWYASYIMEARPNSGVERANRMPSASGTSFAHPQADGLAGRMSRTTLTISSKNYSSWSLRGWLMTKLARIDFEEVVVAPGDADARAEILLLSPSIL